jgi:hypothetical protein
MKRKTSQSPFDKRATRSPRLKNAESVVISARIDKSIADRLDEISKLVVPVPSRSEMLASIVESWMTENPSPEAERKSAQIPQDIKEFTALILRAVAGLETAQSDLVAARDKWSSDSFTARSELSKREFGISRVSTAMNALNTNLRWFEKEIRTHAPFENYR